MKSLTFAIVAALCTVVVSVPALANPYIVENNLDSTIYIRSGSTHSVPAGHETAVIDYPYGFRLSLEPDGEFVSISFYLCEGREKTVHRLEVVNQSPFQDAPTTAPLGMEFISSCEYGQ